MAEREQTEEQECHGSALALCDTPLTNEEDKGAETREARGVLSAQRVRREG